MRFGLDTFTTFLNYFGGRKVESSSNRRARPHNIFAPRNPCISRSRTARLHAAKSAAKLHERRSTANAASGANNTNKPSLTGAAQGAKQRGTRYRRAKRRHLAAKKPLLRCNTVLVPKPPTHPQPPGAFIVEPSFVVPGFPGLDDRYLPPFVALKFFFDALDEGRRELLRFERERKERDEQVEYQRLLEQDLKRAQEARRRAEEAEYARLLEEDRRKAEAAHRRAEKEEFERLLLEDLRKAQEAHHRAMEQEEMQRQAEREAMERELRERERREQECREWESAQSSLITRLRIYEAKWAVLRGNTIAVENIDFHDIPWPSFEDVRAILDITEERVLAFVCHPLHEHIQGPGGGLAKSLRSEMLRWHPDKFEGKVLGKVIEGDREAVREAAGRVARILTTYSAKMR
jgi:hypothetical protein